MRFQNHPHKWSYGAEDQTQDPGDRFDIRYGSKRRRTAFSLSALLRTFFFALRRLLVALWYQLSRLDLGRIRLPWFRLIIAGIIVYLIFQRDLQLQVQMNAPNQPVPAATRTGSALSLSQPLLADKKTPAPPEAEPEVTVDPFAATPDDSERERKVKTYIRRFQRVAVAEMDKYGIPASIKMAQGILESQIGESRLAREINNHFGIKCFSRSCAPGHCTNFHDDHHKDFFRNYDSAWASWRAHSELLASKKYASLQAHGTDFRAWANGLAELGYATDPQYAKKLIQTIEAFQLHLLDQRK